ncbi:aminoglycoside phosphotransferase family protein [Exiguobacterium oxidotolerans]|uniref:Aminoglycoside phosphotransferase n=1 Tax=Exiguobacterium oxidotolerans TaxID=223958 RepID=A0A653I296_9BACL|nr:aminoglycoside phosphotransferase family protein [Exiguobacterium oxidotolerans]VWX33011.1 Aminoglycoside phosphotransferase [Exiguobacterium oxidotolerans]
MATTENASTLFENISRRFKLGELLTEPDPLSGGLLHKMFLFQTTTGTYAVKLLNPSILSRPTARQNFIDSERIVTALAGEVSALPALTIDGSALHQIGTHYYLVFTWVDGSILPVHQVTPNHAELIGEQLAQIHAANLSSLPIQQTAASPESPVPWDTFAEKIRQQGLTALEPFITNLERIKRWDSEASAARKHLLGTTVLSHRDLDAKNVLWKSGAPILIDWESAGPIHPMHDFLETVLYWSLDEQNRVRRDHLEAFVKGYRSAGGRLDYPLEPALSAGYDGKLGWLDYPLEPALSAGYDGKLGWLAYSLSKALHLEPVTEQEQQVAVQQVLETLTALKDYEALCPLIEEWWQENVENTSRMI